MDTLRSGVRQYWLHVVLVVWLGVVAHREMRQSNEAIVHLIQANRRVVEGEEREAQLRKQSEYGNDVLMRHNAALKEQAAAADRLIQSLSHLLELQRERADRLAEEVAKWPPRLSI